MGEVHLAWDTKGRRKVAVKSLPPDFRAHWEFRRRLAGKARITSSLHYPPIVQGFELTDAWGCLHSVMEFVEWRTLDRLIAEEELPAGRSVRFGLQVATQDWHPPGHVSFAGSHPGKQPFDVIPLYGHEQVLWPDHCVRGTAGAELYSELPWETVSAIVRKGPDPECDSHSGIRNNWNREGERPPPRGWAVICGNGTCARSTSAVSRAIAASGGRRRTRWRWDSG